MGWAAVLGSRTMKKMASREHERAVKLALRTGRELKKLFDQMGNVRHPNGRLLSAYRQARRALRGKITDRVAVAQIIDELRRAIRQNTLEQMAAARQLGILQARTELAIYGLPNAALPIAANIGLDVVMSAFETQITQVRAFAEDGDERMVLGDDERVGVLAPGPVSLVSARWLVATAVIAHGAMLKTNLGSRSDEYVRQAVAAIDERTTNCCLKVNGQTTGIDEPFTLTGTPRYAREQMRPGFHDYCRTSVALVPAGEADDDLTERMRAAGAAELRAREDGSRRVIHPASSISGRG